MFDLNLKHLDYASRLSTAIQSRNGELSAQVENENKLILASFTEFISKWVSQGLDSPDIDVSSLSFEQVKSGLSGVADGFLSVFLPILWVIPKFTPEYVRDDSLRTLVAQVCGSILRFPLPETVEEAAALNQLSVGLLALAPVDLSAAILEVKDEMLHVEVTYMLRMFLLPFAHTERDAVMV